MKGGDHSGDLEVDVRIMDLEEIGWTGFIWLRIGTIGGLLWTLMNLWVL
jgi:hypothetical protein